MKSQFKMELRFTLWLLIILFIIIAAILLKLAYSYFNGSYNNIQGGEQYSDFSDDLYSGGKKKKGKGPNSLYIYDKELFKKIQKGDKTFEGRKCFERFNQWKPGDELIFWRQDEETGEDNEIKVIFKGITHYKTIEEMVDALDEKGAIKGATGKDSKQDAIVYYYSINKPETVEKYGFCAIEFELADKKKSKKKDK